LSAPRSARLANPGLRLSRGLNLLDPGAEVETEVETDTTLLLRARARVGLVASAGSSRRAFICDASEARRGSVAWIFSAGVVDDVGRRGRGGKAQPPTPS